MFNFLWINFNWIQTNKQTPSYLQFPEPSKLVQKIQFYSCEGLEREDFPGVWIYHNYCIWKKTYFRNQWLHSVRSYWKDLTWLLHYVCIKTTVYVYYYSTWVILPVHVHRSATLLTLLCFIIYMLQYLFTFHYKLCNFYRFF